MAQRVTSTHKLPVRAQILVSQRGTGPALFKGMEHMTSTKRLLEGKGGTHPDDDARRSVRSLDDDPSRFRPRNYPQDLYTLEAATRRQALRRTTELMRRGYRTSQALRMGIALARSWMDNGRRDTTTLPGPSHHVMYEPDEGWLICIEDRGQPSARFERFDHAMQRAHELASRAHAVIYVHDVDGHLIDKYEPYGGAATSGYRIKPWHDGWAVEIPDSNGRCKEFHTRREAIDDARVRARDAASMLVIHYQDGRLQPASDRLH